MRPWIDRKILISEARQFVKSKGCFLRNYAKRISSLVEVAVYNSVVSYYDQSGFKLVAKNLGPKKSFRYKLSSTGHIRNFSYFQATKCRSGSIICIFHNTKIQSAHHGHLYYTPDVAVCLHGGDITTESASGRKHSFIQNNKLLFFVEVKHLNPFPEVLFSFTGLVQEFMPLFISRKISIDDSQPHLTPTLVFTGVSSEYCERIRTELTGRYGINIIYGTQKTHGKIADFSKLKKYSMSNPSESGAEPRNECR